MKIAVFLTAVALACGTAFAAAPAESSKTTTAKTEKTTTAKTDESSNGSVDRAVAKTKAVVKRAGVKVRETGKRIANATRKATSDRDDTSRMGASGTNKTDEKPKDKAAIARKNKAEDQRKN